MSSSSGKHGIIPLSILFFLLTTPYAVQSQTSSNSGDPYAGYARVTPQMLVIIVVLIAALFFMGFFSVYIRHCSDRAGGGSVRPLVAGAMGRSRRALARGLDHAVIETFPTLVYSVVKGLKIGKGALECAVCLSEFEDDETLRLIPKCDHVFHPDCIDEWLASHTTCPVCRANLVPQPGEPTPQLSELHPEIDLEAQSEAAEAEREDDRDNNENVQVAAPEPEVMSVNQTLNRNRTRGSRSGRPPKFPRSHSTGHSLVQPGENTERFTLRLPDEVRKQIMNRKFNRTMSMVMLPSEGSSRRGYRGEGNSRGKHLNYKRLGSIDQVADRSAKSDRWVFNITPPLLARASFFLTRASSSVWSPRKVASDKSEIDSTQLVEPKGGEPGRPPV